MEDPNIERILTGRTDNVLEIVAVLRQMIKDLAPELREEGVMSEDTITYAGKHVVLGISPYKSYVNLCFFNGAALRDPDGLLQGTGKALRHIRFYKASEVIPEQLRSYIEEAVAQDRQNRVQS